MPPGPQSSAINDTGETQRLIRTIPRKGMRFVGNVREKQKPEAMTEGAGSEPPLPLPDKPSIAVLPFQNMSGDCEQEHFADGASCWAEKAMWARNYLTPLRISVASHALAGRLAEAKKPWPACKSLTLRRVSPTSKSEHRFAAAKTWKGWRADCGEPACPKAKAVAGSHP
jgi:hypothetical protein